MIENWYDDLDAANYRAAAGNDSADQELGERVYTSRLIGQNPDLLMHGGGNTSVKVRRADLFGKIRDVLHVKGSGWDLDVIEAPGLPGVWLEPLTRLRALDSLSDESMVNYQRSNLLNSASPNPSVETLLHAFLPHKYVDHTHATPFLVLANLPNAAECCREIFGERLGIVPYIMPGFALAKKAAEIYEKNPEVEGLLLVQHGHFTFGKTARASYEKIIEHTNEVAKYLGMETPTQLGERCMTKGVDLLPTLRGLIAEVNSERDNAMPVFDLRNGEYTQEFLSRCDVEDLSTRGMASPDHVLRTKGRPLLLTSADLVSRDTIKAKLEAFADEYRAYFKRLSKC
jgi:rhamnose utilization protein RhaD (predicted bifunctional aldolase and dehydrogenase)